MGLSTKVYQEEFCFQPLGLLPQCTHRLSDAETVLELARRKLSWADEERERIHGESMALSKVLAERTASAATREPKTFGMIGARRGFPSESKNSRQVFPSHRVASYTFGYLGTSPVHGILLEAVEERQTPDGREKPPPRVHLGHE